MGTAIWSPDRPAPVDLRFQMRKSIIADDSTAEAKIRVTDMLRDPLTWLREHTQTKDSHWREATCPECGALPNILCPHKSTYKPFPDKPYFRPVVDAFECESILFVEKSRDLMLSWLCVGLFTHQCMTTPGIEVLFQSQKETKAFELVDEYAKTLYERSPEEVRQAYPLAKKLWDQPNGTLEFANGSRIIGIPGGADQIRSYHPWGLFQDEAAFMPEAGKSFNHAVPVCQKIVVVSSAGPGWFADTVTEAEPTE